MATDLKSPNRLLPRHELFVDEQLARASRRIHALDLGRTLLWLLAASLLHALVMTGLYLGLDSRPFGLGWAMQVGVWSIYLGVVAFLLGKLLLRFLSRVNPYYAARQIEEAIPGAKNSVVNWLDLRQRQLPAAIHDALGLRAARDLKTTDPDQAVNSKHGWTLVIVAGVLVFGLLALFIKETERFGSLMGHAFYPLGDVALTSRTKITLLSPAGGDVTVAPQERVLFRARIAGDVPHVNTPRSPRLLYRYLPGDSWVALPLEPETTDERAGPETWTTTMPGDLVQNGFSYKLAAGDAETPQYQVTVRSLPEPNRFEITHHYRPYILRSGWTDDTIIFPNQNQVYPSIRKPVGTEVTMQVRTNRELREGKVELNQGKNLADVSEFTGDVLADDPRSFRVKFKLQKVGLGKFRVRFTSRTGEENNDNYEYDLDVRPDNPPNVKLTKPAEDVKLPANGTLLLEGKASDDFGVRSLSLHLEVARGPAQFSLKPQTYRPDKVLQFADGSFPNNVDYQDFVALDKIRLNIDEHLKLSKGDVLTYWLEATDNCEYPERPGQVGRSTPPYQVTIVDPQDEKKQQSERCQAEQDQKQHEKRQDEDLKQQQEARGQDKAPEQTEKTPEQKKDFENKLDRAERLQKDLEKKANEQKDKAPGSTDKNSGTTDKGTGSTNKGPGTTDKGPGSTDKGPGSTDKGPGTTDKGPGTTDKGPGTTDKGPGTTDKGPGTTDKGPGTTDKGPGTTDKGPGTTDKGPGTTDKGPGTTDKGPGSTDKGPGSTDKGPGTTDKGPGSTDKGPGTTDKGPGTTDKGPGTTDKGPGTTDKGPGTTDKGPGTTDKGPGTTDKGPGTTDKGPGTTDKGPGTTDKGPGTTDKGPGTTDKGPGTTDKGPGTTDKGRHDGQGPARRTRAPARRTRAPARRTRAPARRTRAPARRTRAPARRTRAPARRTRAPARRTRAPARRTRAPARRTRAPARRTRAPARRTRAPARRTRAPARRTRAPARRTRAPARRTRAPARRTRAPARRTRAPARRTRAPARRTRAPARRTRAPARRTRAPARRTRAPARRTRAPARRTRAPARRTRAPARRTRAPARRTRAPARRTRAPARRTRAPARRTRAPARRTRAPARRTRVLTRRTRGLARRTRGLGQRQSRTKRRPRT